MVTPDVVRNAYRLLLGREAESDAVVNNLVAAAHTMDELRRLFLNSPEFASKNRESVKGDGLKDIRSAYTDTYADIEVNVSDPKILAELNARVAKQWGLLGDSDPYWSVLTHDNFRSKNFNETMSESFYGSGIAELNYISSFERRCGVKINRGSCFELGCGVGRVTHLFSQTFKKVIAADISSGNLRLCKEIIQKKHLENVECVLLKDPQGINELDPFDFFYSVIVLQHNPPPIQKVLITNALSKLRQGGYCFFQAPDRLDLADGKGSYRFKAAEFLNRAPVEMDMHFLPKHEVIKILNENKMKIIDIVPDGYTGLFGSYTYFAVKE